MDDPGKYIRGADLVIVPVMNPGGVKIRVLETLFCCKPVIVTPEASVGLPDEFRQFLYVEKDVNGFLRVIMQYLDGTKVKKVNPSVIEDYVSKSRTMCDIINDIYKVEN